MSGDGRYAYANGDRLAALVGLLEQGLDQPDLGVVRAVLATAATRGLRGDPLWLLIVGPPASGKTEVVRLLDDLTDAAFDDLTVAGLLGWVGPPNKSGRPGGVLHGRGGDYLLCTVADLSTLLHDRPSRGSDVDTVFSALRRVFDGSYTRRIGSIPKPLTWAGKMTMIGAVTPAVDRFSAHADALGPRWLYLRSDRHDRAAFMQRDEDELVAWREELRAVAGPIVRDAADRIPQVALGDPLERFCADCALVTTIGRVSVPRSGYGQREMLDVPVREGPSRVAGQLRLLARGLIALDTPADGVAEVVQRAALDSMSPARRAVLAALADSAAPAGLTGAGVARCAGLDRRVVTMALEDLETIDAVEHPDRFADRREPTSLWKLGRLDPERIRAVFGGVGGGCAEKGEPPPSPPLKEVSGGVHPFSAQPPGDPENAAEAGG